MIPALPNVATSAAVIVAAGAGLRAGQPVPKQFARWRGKPLVRHCGERFAAAGFPVIVVVIPQGAEAICAQALQGLPGIRLVTGGATRQASVRAGLEALADAGVAQVYIHDAARPMLPAGVLRRLADALHRVPAAIPVLPVFDSLAALDGGMMGQPAARDRLRRVQTPQAFRYAQILAAHRAWAGETHAGDDAQVAQAAGMEVAVVEGDEALHKVTTAADFASATIPVRIGTGFDVHRLAPGKDLWLGGIKIDHSHGLTGHSDADVVIHALVDAILGALADGDIGLHFPPGDAQWRGASSDRFLTYAAGRAGERGYVIGNVDLTIICEAPKIGPHRDAIRQRLAELLGTDISSISVKATTTERLGFAGRGEGIAAQAAVTLLAAPQ